MPKRKKKKSVRKSTAKKTQATEAKKPAKTTKPAKESEKVKSVDLAEDLTEPVPHEAITDPRLAKYLIIIVVVLVVVVGILWWVMQNARTQQINSVQSQDNLQNVTPSESQGLQPGSSSGADLQGSASPQPNSATGNQLQPSQSSTPSQVNQ